MGEGESGNPTLVLVEDKNKYRAATTAMSKGSMGMTPERVANWIINVGYGKIILKSDKEPAIADLQNESNERLTKEMHELAKHVSSIKSEVVLENSPVGGSQSDGIVEGTIEQIQGQIRTMRLDFESKFRRKFTPEYFVWPRHIEYAADTFNRFRVGEEGLTPFKRLKARDSAQPVAAFGEKLLFQRPKQVVKRMDKSQSRWEREYSLDSP